MSFVSCTRLRTALVISDPTLYFPVPWFDPNEGRRFPGCPVGWLQRCPCVASALRPYTGLLVATTLRLFPMGVGRETALLVKMHLGCKIRSFLTEAALAWARHVESRTIWWARFVVSAFSMQPLAYLKWLRDIICGRLLGHGPRNILLASCVGFGSGPRGNFAAKTVTSPRYIGQKKDEPTFSSYIAQFDRWTRSVLSYFVEWNKLEVAFIKPLSWTTLRAFATKVRWMGDAIGILWAFETITLVY